MHREEERERNGEGPADRKEERDLIDESDLSIIKSASVCSGGMCSIQSFCRYRHIYPFNILKIRGRRCMWNIRVLGKVQLLTGDSNFECNVNSSDSAGSRETERLGSVRGANTTTNTQHS